MKGSQRFFFLDNWPQRLGEVSSTLTGSDIFLKIFVYLKKFNIMPFLRIYLHNFLQRLSLVVYGLMGNTSIFSNFVGTKRFDDLI